MSSTVTVSDSSTVVVETNQNSSVIVSGLLGPRGISRINAAIDVDTTLLSDGSTLVYSSSSQKWETVTTLEKQTINAGFF